MDKQATLSILALAGGRRTDQSATFTEKPHCIAPNHACPLAAGQCLRSCYLADCEPKQEAA